MRTERARRLLLHEGRHLEAMRIGLRRDLELEAASLACELSTIDQHLADQATDVLDREVEASVLQSVDAALAEVQAALERIDRGTYGVCEACGATIPEARLEAAPTARTCVEHEASPPAAPASGHGSLEPARSPSDDEDDDDQDPGPEAAALHLADAAPGEPWRLEPDQLEAVLVDHARS